MRKMLLVLLSLFLLPSVSFAHGMSEADQLQALDGGFFQFVKLGASHMITGYDHLLFLVGVVFFLSQFKDIVKFVTAFTIGHSITLIFATFMGIQANYFLIDAVIALTVCYKGFDNLDGFQKYLDMKSPNLIGMVFIFGLIHGFGLSTRLQMLPIGEGGELLMKIIAFNIGVEGGQIIALTIILLVLSGIRHTESFKRFSTAANFSLILIGGLLLLMQLHGYSHERDPMGFYNQEAHKHQHEDMGLPGEGERSPDVAATHGHSHGAADKFDPIITAIFETRELYKNAQTDDDVLESHHPIEDIYDELVKLRKLIAEIEYLDFEQIDIHMKSAVEFVKAIDAEAHDGNVEKTKELVKQFDGDLLAIEELINHPVLPEGYHVDEPGGTPHKH